MSNFKDAYELLEWLTENLESHLDPDNAIDRLILREDAFSWSPEVEELFTEAMKLAYKRQMERFPQYAKGVEVARRRGEAKYPDEIESIEDLRYVLPVSVWTLKTFEFEDRSSEDILLTLSSSGTSGMRSQIKLSERSLRRIVKIVFNVYGSYGIRSDLPSNYLMFSYEITRATGIGTAFSDALLSTLAPRREVFWAFKWDEDIRDFRFNVDEVIKALGRFHRDWEERGVPLRILGFPAYIWFTLEELDRRGIRFRFGGESWVLPGGGWKTLEDKEIPKEVFRWRIRELLGIPEDRVRDLYGMVEHGVPYVECERWEFHVPIYSRVLVLDPGYGYQSRGKLGLFHMLTPYIDSYPSISIITSDAGAIEEPTCHRASDRLVLVGRAGKLKLRGCAIDALRLLESLDRR